MEYGINDPLKAASFGHKKDIGSKIEHIKHVQESDQQYYPIEKDGNINEWKALLKQQQTLHESQMKEQEYRNYIHKQQLKNELQHQAYTKHQTEQLQTQTQKQQEAIENEVQNQALSQMQQQKVVQNKTYQQYLGKTYKANADQKKEKERMEKEELQEQERELQRRVMHDMELERKRLEQERKQFISEADQVRQMKTQEKLFEKNRSETQKKEYQQLFWENSKREEKRENEYRQFFNDYENGMNQRMNNHLNQVLKGEMSKQSHLDEIEQKYVEQRLKQVNDKEEGEIKKRKDQLNDMQSYNKVQGESEYERKIRLKNEEAQRKYAQRKKEEEEMKKLQDQEREKMVEQKKMYKNTLDYQKQIQSFNSKQLGSMTQMEKKMNRADLREFKHKGAAVNAMVPGINNLPTVGSSPMARKGFNVKSKFDEASAKIGAIELIPTKYQSPTLNTNQKLLEIQKEYLTTKSNRPQPSADLINPLANARSQSSLFSSGSRNITDRYATASGNQGTPTNISKFGFNQKRSLQTSQSQSSLNGYNPITNPVPFVSQNPYINKQMQMVSANNSLNPEESLLSKGGTISKSQSDLNLIRIIKWRLNCLWVVSWV